MSLAISEIATGEIAGSATAAQLPSVVAKQVNFKAARSNAGNVYIGTASGLTVADGTTDITTGFELDAGEETGWIFVPGENLNSFYRICDNAGDDLSYMVIR
jgi:hypothetical protein